MKRPCLSMAAAVLLLAGLNGNAAAQASCNAPLGWWESKGLLPLFTDPNGPPPKVDCDFHAWSWTAFVHWMQNDPATGQPLFLALPTFDDLKSGNALRAKVGPRKLELKPRVQKPQAMSGIEQAGSHGVLIDQNGRALYYSTHMDPVYFQFTQKYFGPNNYRNAAPDLAYPIAATVFKAAWRIVPAGQKVQDAFTTTADIALIESDGKGGLKTNDRTQSNVTVALVGVHVVGVIKDHPEFAWGTFEQVANAPDLPPGMSPTSSGPVDTRDYTFYKGGTPANVSNQKPRSYTLVPETQVVSPITPIFRQFAYGGATPPTRVADIQSANENFQAAIKGGKKTISPVFGNYRLIGTAWILANTLKPGNGNLNLEAIGSIDLANATLETFVQGSGRNCFMCHNTSGGSTYPGKDINISHIILGGVPSKPVTLNAYP